MYSITRAQIQVGFHADQIHKIQKCDTKTKYDKELRLFARGYPEAARYLDEDCDHAKTFLYAILKDGFTTHGHVTSNIAEIINNIISDARFGDPLHLIDVLLQWLGDKLNERQIEADTYRKTKTLLTSYAMQHLVRQVRLQRTCT